MSERRPNPADPTAERTSEQSTQTASGLGGGQPDGEEPRRTEDTDEEVIGHSGDDERATPRRYDEAERDPVMPADDSSVGTKI